MTDDLMKLIVDTTRLFNQGIREAQARHRKLGIPNVYLINGIMVYEYDGKITMTPPKGWKKGLAAMERKYAKKHF